MVRAPPPTDAELAILGVLWGRGPATVREVHEALEPEGNRGYTTLLKLMQIMFDKGLLARQREGRRHIYRARISRAPTEKRLVRELIDRAFGGSAASLVLSAIGSGRADAAERARIRALLDEMDADECRRGADDEEVP